MNTQLMGSPQILPVALSWFWEVWFIIGRENTLVASSRNRSWWARLIRMNVFAKKKTMERTIHPILYWDFGAPHLFCVMWANSHMSTEPESQNWMTEPKKWQFIRTSLINIFQHFYRINNGIRYGKKRMFLHVFMICTIKNKLRLKLNKLI